MAHEDRDPQDTQQTRSARRATRPMTTLSQDEFGYGEPINPNWRSDRATSRGRKSQTLPSSRQEFLLWLQYGGLKHIAIVVAGIAILAILGMIVFGRQFHPLSTPIEPTADASFEQYFPDLATTTPLVTTPTAAINSQGVGRFQIINTGSEGLFLRSTPDTINPPVKTVPDGTIVTIIGTDFIGPDRVWKHVRDPEGSEGWLAADYLQQLP